MRMIPEKACEHCWETFTPNRSSSQKYCSDICRRLAGEKQYEPRKCKKCKKLFTPKTHGQKYCKKPCKSGYIRKHPKYKHECFICGGTFKCTSANAKYCSYDCKMKNYRDKYKDRVYTPDNDTSLRFRFTVLKRDMFTCQYCGRTPQMGAVLHVDHIHPESKGGTTELENMVTACFECNLGKTDIILTRKQARAMRDLAHANKK